MSASKLRQEIEFGLQNLDKVYSNISRISEESVSQETKTSALAYECVGYYNAIEHLIIRMLKHFNLILPTGEFSHRQTLKSFESLLDDKSIEFHKDVITSIEDLMAFRHVATKIYGFLLDWDKLEIIIHQIEENHKRLKKLFLELL